MKWFSNIFKSKQSKKLLSKRETFENLMPGDLVSVHLRSESFFKCYPNGTPRIDQDIIAKGVLVGHVVKCKKTKYFWTLEISAGRPGGVRHYFLLEDEIENVRKVDIK